MHYRHSPAEFLAGTNGADLSAFFHFPLTMLIFPNKSDTMQSKLFRCRGRAREESAGAA